MRRTAGSSRNRIRPDGGRLLILAAVSLFTGSAASQDLVDDSPTGTYRHVATSTDILGADRAEAFSAVVPVNEPIDWEVAVDDSYDPRKPPGVLVYISPSNSGKIPRHWLRLLASHNLIWVAANRSGNRIQVARRSTFAVLGAALSAKLYEIDGRRVYLAGFSGGARVSGLVAASYPTLFRGGIYVGGAESWGQGDRPDKLESMQRNRYVFLVGSEDANRVVARTVHTKYLRAGIDQLSMMVVRRLGHELPDTRHMANALDFLDGV